MTRKKLGSMAIISLIATAVFVSVALAASYTIGQDSQDNLAGNPYNGQSFTTIGAGKITQIDLASKVASTRVLTIYQGEGVAGKVLYSQSVTLQPDAGGAYNTFITLSTPVPVSAGSSYTFVFDGHSSLYVKGGDPYSGGHLYVGLVFSGFGGLAIHWPFDLKFKVHIEANPVAVGGVAERISLTPVQEGQLWLQEYGLIALGCALAVVGAGALAWRKR